MKIMHYLRQTWNKQFKILKRKSKTYQNKELKQKINQTTESSLRNPYYIPNQNSSSFIQNQNFFNQIKSPFDNS